ncbi:aspartate/glutamate racemase family protein [Streptomyces sp. NPDC053493]|uniref:aspartate/glutamate racemase family protein n=1 Tax=Streptomyces sp. NPDC053493 TaxID=3365705 RepID=UPI0037D6F3AA
MLVNPNTSTATTRMMTTAARRALAGSGLRVRGVTVAHGPPMLTDPAALRAAAPHVVAAARQALATGDCAAVVVAAFGDPGLPELRAWLTPGATDLTDAPDATDASVPPAPGGAAPYGGFAPGAPPAPGASLAPGVVPALGELPAPGVVPALGASPVRRVGASVASSLPVVGIGEAALLEAADGGRRFGIATTTPRLGEEIAAHVERLGLAARYTGARFTLGAPEQLAARPEAQLAALMAAARACVRRDGAEAVVIGGGPLAQAAEALRSRLAVPVIAPVPAACRRVARLLGAAE